MVCKNPDPRSFPHAWATAVAAWRHKKGGVFPVRGWAAAFLRRRLSRTRRRRSSVVILHWCLNSFPARTGDGGRALVNPWRAGATALDRPPTLLPPSCPHVLGRRCNGRLNTCFGQPFPSATDDGRHHRPQRLRPPAHARQVAF